MNDMYLTPEDYEIAEQNGIPRKTAYYRLYVLNWSKERTITTPVNKKGHLKHLYQQAIKNGNDISYSTLAYRKNFLKWSDEDAVNIPSGGRKRKSEDAQYTELAEENGIKRISWYTRVYQYGWDKHRAATEPIRTQYRKKVQP